MEETTRQMGAALGPIGWGPEAVLGAWWDWYRGGRLTSAGFAKKGGGGGKGPGSDLGQLAWLRVIGTPGWSEPVEAAFAAEFDGKPFPRLRYPLADDPERLKADFRRRLAISLLQKPFAPLEWECDRSSGNELARAQLERSGRRVELR